jgi:hypothetical protein
MHEFFDLRKSQNLCMIQPTGILSRERERVGCQNYAYGL